MPKKNKGRDNGTLSALSLPGSKAGTRSVQAVSMYSFTTSINEEKEAVKSILENKQSNATQMAKMLLVIAVPVISQMALSILNLARSTSVQTNVAMAQDAINNFFLVDNLVTSLQVERGTTATFLSSDGVNKEAYNRLVNIRITSDKAMAAVQDWPEKGIRIGYVAFVNKEVFMQYLNNFRLQADKLWVDVNTNIRFYTDITQAFMSWAQAEVKLPERGKIWPLVVSQVCLMRASDAIGIQRALGATFTTLCGMDQDGMRWYQALNGKITSSLSFAFGYHRKTMEEYMDTYTGSILQREILHQEELLTDPEFMEACRNFSDAERFARSGVWFANMTQYMSTIKDIRTHLTSEIYKLLQTVTTSQEIEVVAYSLALATVTVLCLGLTFWYSSKLNHILSRISGYAKKMAAKSTELNYEKKRSEALLGQMLPKAVAEQLKANKEVEAEFFEQVTVMFSDIVGFIEICSLTSPLQVVDMLNLLYSVFDAAIDRYDVYKVETIGDSYMVVSGVPYVIEHHAIEMAHLSLELMIAVKGVAIPHMPGKKLSLRVGMHSGSCTAGVVGLRMPRYCLFGDTVNTTSRMDSTGLADKIQISQPTRDLLVGHGGFITEHRGEITVKGKGEMSTYFLQGCKGGICQHIRDPRHGRESRKSVCTPHPHKELKFED